ncbi:MAG: gamma-glutamyltransferase [Hydrotalea sp.]|nr:gamma-glutamyltransferase [Hydrotalea sp.]
MRKNRFRLSPSSIFAQVVSIVMCLLLVGCGPNEFGILWQPSGTGNVMVGTRDGNHYFISADEPYATLIGNKTFLERGNAVDAAVATAIAMTATQPLSASLGAGGACQGLLPNVDGDLTPFAVSFAGDNPSSSMASVLYQIQIKHGRLPWEKMVAPAEKLIRLGFTDNAATKLQTANPFWQRDTNGVVTMPELAESFSTLRLRPLTFIFGVKDGTMNPAYQSSGLGYNQKMTTAQALRTVQMTPLANLKMQKFNNGAAVALIKNQNMTGYARQWVNYLVALNGYANGDVKVKPKQPGRAGTAMMESSVMAVDESGRALSCHFAVQDSADTTPVKVGNLGFFAPLDGLKSIAARGFFILDAGGTPFGLVSLGQSARGVVCQKNMANNFFDNGTCRWVRSDTDSALTIMGVR